MKWKTLCCQADFYQKGRANLRCMKCDKDVTIEVSLFEEFKMNSKKDVVKQHYISVEGVQIPYLEKTSPKFKP